MALDRIGFLLGAVVVLAITSTVSAGPVAGIVRTDGQPLETGPFDSHSTPAGPEISHDFQPMYLTSQPNIWTKTFQWEIAANTGLVPGNTGNGRFKFTVMRHRKTVGSEHGGYDLGDVVDPVGRVGRCDPSNSVNEVISDLNGGVMAGIECRKIAIGRQTIVRLVIPAQEWRPTDRI